MNKLELLDELIIRVKTKEITLQEGTEDALTTLLDIVRVVEQSLYDEIVRDITDSRTEYFAPEYPSWKHFLADCNGYGDYRQMLIKFTNEELESMWQNSHIAEDMTEEKIKADMVLQIGQLKMLSLMGRPGQASNADKIRKMSDGIEARIKGLYNMLYE